MDENAQLLATGELVWVHQASAESVGLGDDEPVEPYRVFVVRDWESGPLWDGGTRVLVNRFNETTGQIEYAGNATAYVRPHQIYRDELSAVMGYCGAMMDFLDGLKTKLDHGHQQIRQALARATELELAAHAAKVAGEPQEAW